MEFKKNLLENDEKKSIYRILVGFIFIALSIAWIYTRYTDNQPIRVFDWLYFGFFALNGTIHLIEGFGIPITLFFGKAYISINKENIIVKSRIFEKEQRIAWNEIVSIEFKPTRILFIIINNTQMNIDYSKLEYEIVIKIKESLNLFAKEKNIELLQQ
jgi:hypothetical protein